MTKEEKIKDYLDEQLYDYELVAVWDDYCARTNCKCDVIYYMNEFDCYYSGQAPYEIAQRLFNSTHFNPNERWFSIDGYGNPLSFVYPLEYISTVNLAEYIVESGEDFGYGAIRNILEEDGNED